MKILSIALYDLKKMFRDRGSLIMVIMVPLVFTFVFGLIFGNIKSSSGGNTVLPIAIVNYDQSPFTNDLLNLLNQDETISVSLIKEKDLYDQVKNADVEAGFIIPKNFSQKLQNGEKPDIQVVKLPSASSYMTVETSINTALTKMSINESTMNYFEKQLQGKNIGDTKAVLDNIRKNLNDSLKKPDFISVKESYYGKSKSDTTSSFSTAQSIIGINIMFLMFTVIMGGAGTILDERKIRTWDRLDISPTGKSQIMAGKIIGTFLKGWVQAGILILFGKYVMGVNWGNSLPATVVIMSVYLLSGMGIGLLFSTIIRTNSQLTAISAVIIVSTSMLSGCYWPLEISPVFMQKIATLFPQYWAMKGLKETVIANRGFDAIIQPVIILLAIAALFYILAVLAEVFKGFGKRKAKAVF